LSTLTTEWTRVLDDHAAHRRSDETGPASHKNSHATLPFSLRNHIIMPALGSRASMNTAGALALSAIMDCRDEPGNDNLGCEGCYKAFAGQI
jgi:hypothetical protein